MSGAAQNFADFFDGKTAVARRVAYAIDNASGTLSITPPEAAAMFWRFEKLREVPDQAARGQLVVTTVDHPLMRLHIIDKNDVSDLRPLARDLRLKPPVRGKSRVLFWAAGAVAAVFAIVFVLVPVMSDQLARILPPSGEQALGEATLGQIQSALSNEMTGLVPTCDAPDGLDALEQMREAVEGANDGLPYPVRVTVLDHDMINAFALPGGQVVFFRGMIDAAENPDGIAAVMAHEIGHVAARDPTRIALRSAGSLGVLGLLFGDFAGGAVVLLLIEQLIQAEYSRDAEAAADAFAIARLRDADINPAALGDLFQVLRDEYGDVEGIAAHFTSHPALGDRIAAARAAGAEMGDTRPVLNATQWAALRAICD